MLTAVPAPAQTGRPSAAALARLEPLQNTHFVDGEAAFGRGLSHDSSHWFFDRLETGDGVFAVLHGATAEKRVFRDAYRIPLRTDGDVADLYRRLTRTEAKDIGGALSADYAAFIKPPPVPLDPRKFTSGHLGATIAVLDGVFSPAEAESAVLPFMHDHPAMFEGKRVLEIGTGSGIIALYAAKLGARRVVATDINEQALACARANAQALGVAESLDPRLVPLSDMSAYSVARPDETFDTIISNPPYVLDLDAETNDAYVDNGDLGFSIVRGFEQRLAPGGVAVLFYGSYFFHEVMAKFARHSGYDVRNHSALGLMPWEMEALFNQYLRRLLQHEKLPADAFRFRLAEDRLPYALMQKRPLGPLVEGDDGGRYYPGIIVIRRPPK